jgi:hypothetical protein
MVIGPSGTSGTIGTRFNPRRRDGRITQKLSSEGIVVLPSRGLGASPFMMAGAPVG